MARRFARSIARPRYAAASTRRVRVGASPSAGAKTAPVTAVNPSPHLGSRVVRKEWFRRPQIARVARAFAFAAVLVLTLGFSWRDGGAGGDAAAGGDGDGVTAKLAAPAYDGPGDAFGRDLRSRVQVVVGAVSEIPPPQAPVHSFRAPRKLVGLQEKR